MDRGETRSNSGMLSTYTHQWAHGNVVIPPIIRTALQQEEDASLTEDIQDKDNMRGGHGERAGDELVSAAILGHNTIVKHEQRVTVLIA